MAKVKKAFFCQVCGNQSSKWVGKCLSCGEWNSYVEELVSVDKSTIPSTPILMSQKTRNTKPVRIQDVIASTEQRIQTPDEELNRVLGGGIVLGSLVLIGGEPGIGKSTLLLQLALSLKNIQVLYISGEESESQIKMRADRLGFDPNECYLYTETETNDIFTQIVNLEPQVVIVDSIQTIYSKSLDATPGSVSQIRHCAGEFMRFAKENNIPVFLIGHITKDGNIAGPKILEHLVDTVLQFEGDRNGVYRIVRAIKNRFGSTSELGIYEMRGMGLRQVSNPSEILLTQRTEACSGVAIGTTLEGNRPLLVEVQALVSAAAYGTPQRSTTGFDSKRLNMLLAVLEKRGGYRLSTQDVFLNIAGGLYVEDPAIDLAVCVAIVSSLENRNVPLDWCFAAEVGLGGEIRAVNRVETRIAEAEKLGFKHLVVSQHNQKQVEQKATSASIQVQTLQKLEHVLKEVFYTKR